MNSRQFHLAGGPIQVGLSEEGYANGRGVAVRQFMRASARRGGAGDRGVPQRRGGLWRLAGDLGQFGKGAPTARRDRAREEPRARFATPSTSALTPQPSMQRALRQPDSQTPQPPELLPGYRVKIIDGNHLAATERRLEVLRQSYAGPLPGQSLVILDPSLMQAIDVLPCEDGHAQERSLTEPLLGCVTPRDVWVADRNFCTTRLLFGIAEREAFYVIRQHASTAPWQMVGARQRKGRMDTGVLYEQEIVLTEESGEPQRARRISIQLDKPTRDGEAEIHILTNLPKSAATAKQIAKLYRERWTLEVLLTR